MKFFAKLHGVPGLPKAEVSHSDSPKNLEIWAGMLLASYPPSKFPEAAVVVYELIAVPRTEFKRPSDENTTLESKEIQ